MMNRAAILSLIALALIVAVSFLKPIAQDPSYHQFADTRTILAIPNFANVVSNLPFSIIGIAGLLLVAIAQEKKTRELRAPWLMFFFGITLTAFGSGYYHWLPANASLQWDRPPMTLGLTSLFCIVVGEYFSASLARKLLLPLLLLGAGSVLYWSHTENLGRGDLRPYAIVQFLPVIMIPLIVLWHRGVSDLGKYLAWMLIFYVAAKIVEHNDRQIFAVTATISGHTIKHLLAALAPLSLLLGLSRRQSRPQALDETAQRM